MSDERLCVCVSVCSLRHSHSTAWTQMQLGGMVGVPSSCALLGRFVVGVQVSLLQQIAPNAECQRVLVLALCLVD